MELKRYLRAIQRRWKIVGAVALATIAVAAFLVSRQASVYEASGTYVVRPVSLEVTESLRATDALNRGVEINSTFARIARSDVVKRRAREAVESAGLSTSGVSATSSVVPDTNILELGARGRDPEAVAAYATAVGEETAAYLREIGEVFSLEQLDTPEVPSSAVASNKSLTMALSVVLGLAAGAALAFAVEYLSERTTPAGLNITDSRTGTYSEEYFRLRLRQEMSRCGVPPGMPSRRDLPESQGGSESPTFSLALLHLQAADSGHNGSGSVLAYDLRLAAQTLLPRLRDQDVLAYIGNDTFAVIFPDLPCTPARELLTGWNHHISETTRKSHAKTTIRASLRVCECDAGGLLGDEDSMRVACGV